MGGGLTHRIGKSETCRQMGFVSVYYSGFYLVLAAWNRYFNSTGETIQKGTLNKDLSNWKQKKQDDLGRFINELAD